MLAFTWISSLCRRVRVINWVGKKQALPSTVGAWGVLPRSAARGPQVFNGRTHEHGQTPAGDAHVRIASARLFAVSCRRNAVLFPPRPPEWRRDLSRPYSTTSCSCSLGSSSPDSPSKAPQRTDGWILPRLGVSEAGALSPSNAGPLPVSTTAEGTTAAPATNRKH